MKTVLVNMPFSSLERPSLALGLLSAALDRHGLENAVHHANLFFAREVGLSDYVLVSRSHPDMLLGEWIFSSKAFPGFQADAGAYLGRFRRSYPHYCRQFAEGELEARLAAIRAAADRFVDETAQRVLGDRPTVVGCSSTFQQQVPSLALLRRVRELAPETATMMGGANCEAAMGRAAHRAFAWVDFVVSGDGEDAVVDLVRAVLEHGPAVPARRVPPGVYAPCHRRTGYPEAGGARLPRAEVRSLEDLPRPNFDHYFRELETIPLLKRTLVPALPMEIARGCWWGRCTFCGLNGAQIAFRARPAELVLDQMAELSARHEINRFLMVDTVLKPDIAAELLPGLVRQGSPYRIFCEVRADLDGAQIRQMSDAGIRWVQGGVESLHDGSLALMRKGTRVWQNLRFLKWCRQHGIRVLWTLLHSFPQEEDSWLADMSRLVPAITHLEPPFNLSNVRFDRFSRYWRSPQEYGLSLRPAGVYADLYPLAREQLADLAYFFEDRASGEGPAPADPDIARALRSFTRQGFAALVRAVGAWMDAFASDRRPTLEVLRRDPTVLIRDTRPAAAAASVELDGIEARVCLACGDGAAREDLLERLGAGGDARRAAERAIEKLKECRLILDDGEHLLFLAVDAPCRPYPEGPCEPFGWIEPARDPAWEPDRRVRSLVQGGGGPPLLIS